MSIHSATLRWNRDGADFTANRYSRVHEWAFDGGITVRASSSPDVVPPPFSDAHAVDPEEAFVAALASCHMLWFLSIAAKRGWCVERYTDSAEGHMSRDPENRLYISRVDLRPQITFGGNLVPEPSQIEEVHHQAHNQCFLANSVRTEVLVHAEKALLQ